MLAGQILEGERKNMRTLAKITLIILVAVFVLAALGGGAVMSQPNPDQSVREQFEQTSRTILESIRASVPAGMRHYVLIDNAHEEMMASFDQTNVEREDSSTIEQRINEILRSHNQDVVSAHNFGANYIPSEVNSETKAAILTLLDQISAERALAARIDVLDEYINKKPFSLTWVNIHREMTDELAALRQSTGEER